MPFCPVISNTMIRKLLPFISLLSLLTLTLQVVAEENPNTVKVGFISILTGQYSDVGQGMANAALLAVEDYRKAHPSEKVDFVLEDDGADAKKGLSAYLRLKEFEHCNIIMPVSTFAIGSVRERVNRQHDLTFVLGNEPYEPEDDFIYMVSPAAIPADRALGAHVAEAYPRGAIQIVISRNEAMQRFGAAAKEGTGDRGAVLELPADTTDLRGVALAIKRDAPSALIMFSLPADTARLVKELRRINANIPLYFDESLVNSLSDVRTILGDLSALGGAKILTLQTNTDPDFLKRYGERFGTSGKIWIDYAYDAVQLALLLKDRPVDEARQWLATESYRGVSGDVRFDGKGLRVPGFSIISLSDHPNFKDAVKQERTAK